MDALRRHMLASCAIVGAAVGLTGGTTYAYSGSFQHTAGLWNHGIDGHHHYATRTDGGSSQLYTHSVNCVVSGGCNNGDDVGYVGNHVHGDGPSGIEHMFGAHFASPGPYLGHHEHN